MFASQPLLQCGTLCSTVPTCGCSSQLMPTEVGALICLTQLTSLKSYFSSIHLGLRLSNFRASQQLIISHNPTWMLRTQELRQVNKRHKHKPNRNNSNSHLARQQAWNQTYLFFKSTLRSPCLSISASLTYVFGYWSRMNTNAIVSKRATSAWVARHTISAKSRTSLYTWRTMQSRSMARIMANMKKATSFHLQKEQ